MRKKITTALGVILFAVSSGFAVANEAITTQPIAQGQLVLPGDISMWPETSRNEAGLAITSLIGSQNLLPATNPLTITPSASAMTFGIGGSGQVVIAQDSASGGSGNTRVIDSCPSQTITIPANSTGSTRNDLLSIMYVSGNPTYPQSQTNPHSVLFSNNIPATVSNALESCAYQYVTATSTPPAGYIAFATVAVPNGATTASQATVAYLFPTVAAQLTSVLGGLVTSVNAKQGAVTLATGNGLLLTTSGNTITETLSTPVTQANGGNGTSVPTLTPGTNLSSSGSWAAQTLNVVNNPTFSGPVSNTNYNEAFDIVNGATTTQIGAPTGIFVSGVNGNLFGIALKGNTWKETLDTSGDMGLSGSLISAGTIVAGAGTAGFTQTGDLAASQSTSGGALRLGGSTAEGTFDFGINNAVQFTLNAPINVTGKVNANGAVVAYSTGGTPPTSVVGDLVSSINSTTGALLLGGASAVGTIDYGIHTVGDFTLGGTTNVLGTLNATGNINGVNGSFTNTLTSGIIDGTGGTFPLVYVGGFQVASKPVVVAGSLSVPASSAASFPFGYTYTANPFCTATWASGAPTATPYISALNTSVVNISNSTGGALTANVICVGQ